MTAVANIPPGALSMESIEKVLIKGDLSTLSPEQRVMYHNKVCESLGLNPLTQPFAYIELNRKLVLYAKRDATDQLRTRHSISIQITAREKIEDIYVVTAQARTKEGRTDESTGAVAIKNLSGESLANALMKAETKAKRRVTLSVCGLGLLDETEVGSEPTQHNDPIKKTEELPVKKELAKALSDNQTPLSAIDELLRRDSATYNRDDFRIAITHYMATIGWDQKQLAAYWQKEFKKTYGLSIAELQATFDYLEYEATDELERQDAEARGLSEDKYQV